jgi:hypothetical protein
MRKADFTACIKKIEFAPKPTKDGWSESFRLVLGDIELTNENLVEIHQFRPNEPIMVTFEPVQINLSDIGKKTATEELFAYDTNDIEEFIDLEENQPDPPPSAVLKTFKL